MLEFPAPTVDLNKYLCVPDSLTNGQKLQATDSPSQFRDGAGKARNPKRAIKQSPTPTRNPRIFSVTRARPLRGPPPRRLQRERRSGAVIRARLHSAASLGGVARRLGSAER